MMHRSALMLMFSGVIGLSGSVWARQPDLLTPPDHTKPKVFGWNEVPGAFTPHARLGRIMHIDLGQSPLSNGSGAIINPYTGLVVTPTSPNHAKQVAQVTAKRIYDALVGANGEHRVEVGRLCILLKNFGMDSAWSGFPPFSGAGFTFFRQEDQLADFPVDQFPQDDDSARSYRHPFIVNASAENPPLKVWMQDFVNEYVRIQSVKDMPGYVGVALPDPERFYFDTEAKIAFAPGVNAMFMIDKLASDYPALWEDAEIPALGNATLKDLYASARSGYGWSTSVVAQVDQTQWCLEMQNRGVAIWWFELMHKVESYVMKKCAYDVIHAAWPGVKCGNYNEFTADGQPFARRTGWMLDRTSTLPADNDNSVGDRFLSTVPHGPTDQFKRLAVDTNWGVSMMYTTQGSTLLRFLGETRTVRGDVHMPPLYEMTFGSVFGSGYVAAAQTNQYLPPGTGEPCQNIVGGSNTFAAPCETLWETSMRAHRQTAEAIIESTDPTRGDQLVPWIDMAGNNITEDGLRYVEEAETRVMLMMLRAKGVREVCMFIGAYGINPAVVDGWTRSARVIDAVFDPYVSRYIKLRGGYQLPHVHDPNRLEFTLPTSSGADSAVVINSTPTILGSTTHSTELRVDFLWPPQYDNPDEPPYHSFGPPYEVAMSNLRVYVECGVTRQDVEGRVDVGKPLDATTFVWVPTIFDESGNEVYQFHAPLDTAADPGRPPLYRSRRESKFVLSPSVPDASMWWDSNVRRWRTTVRLVHTSHQGPFQSHYTLVQIAPDWEVANPLDVEGGIAMVSDMNHDGFSDVLDAMQFVNDWDEYWFSADMNQDGSVDAEDVMVFFDALAEGN